MFHEFSTGNIQIDKDFSAKLSGYGCITNIQETEISCNSVVSSLICCCSQQHVFYLWEMLVLKFKFLPNVLGGLAEVFRLYSVV